ncbi:MAG: D-alanyl-D-alanine carboxypeptidase family protein [Oscillospiraceae bacterium]|nr:D-alanyl-D-alanine carboxypeptidase family protein [Oscillospiraceae bacterium]
MAQKKQKTVISNSPLPLAIVAVFGLAAGVTFIVADHSPRTRAGIENSVPVQEEVLSSESTTEVTATTADSTSIITSAATTVTEAQSLPPGSVTGLTLSFYDAALKVGDDPVMPLVKMTPDEATDKSEKWESTDEKVAKVDGLGNITAVGAGSCVIRVTSVNNPAVFAEVKVSVADPNAAAKTKPAEGAATTTAAASAATTTDPNRTDMEVIDGVTYIQGVMIVNKTYSLPQSYNPNGLTAETKAAFAELQAAASADGLSIYSVSDFRSYEAQDTLYNNYVARDGKEAADTYSARPGHSEHQTGLTIDCNYAGDAFHDTPEAKWLENNAWKYGFIIRFPKGKEDKTGFKYESWHIRYVGKDMAKKIYDSGLCLEEYFGIESKYAE